MKKIIVPSFLPGVLIICLVIGLVANMIFDTGTAIALLAIVLLMGISFLFVPQLNRMSFSKIRIGMLVGLGIMLMAQIMTLVFFPNTVYHDPYRVLSQADQIMFPEY